ncbi:MAG: prenyltransferase/squalene oxidase repeat-containing protein [bacterium]
MDLAKFDSAKVKQAIERGIKRLRSEIHDGRWKGFPTLAGESDQWVSAFILAHLYAFAPLRRALKKVQEFLLTCQNPDGGWSYCAEVPSDADSTAWCLLALKGNRQFKNENKNAALSFLENHRNGNGYTTFSTDSGIKEYIKVESHKSIAGWTSAHPDVTASVLLAGVPANGDEDAENILADLVAQQTGAGFFDAYWWRGPHYTTTLALRVLSTRRRRLPGSQSRLLLRALKREQLPSGEFSLGASLNPEAFTTALALESFSHLQYLGGARERRAAGIALMNMQQEDGRWKGNFIMRIPAPNVVDPRHIARWSRQGGGGNSYILDKYDLFTTVMACHALACWRRVESRKSDTGRPHRQTIRPVKARKMTNAVQMTAGEN